MAPGDSAHGIGAVRHPLALAACSGGRSMWGIRSSWDSEIRKLVTFVSVAQQPVVAS